MQASIRAVCTILDAFHFPLPPKTDTEQLKEGRPDLIVPTASSERTPVSSTAVGQEQLQAAQDVQKVLVKQVCQSVLTFSDTLSIKNSHVNFYIGSAVIWP